MGGFVFFFFPTGMHSKFLHESWVLQLQKLIGIYMSKLCWKSSFFQRTVLDRSVSKGR